MLTETTVSTILEASITGAGLIVAIYALITPISSKIFEKRFELLKEKRTDFDKLKKEITSESSKKDLKQLRTLASEIQKIRTFPKYLGFGVLAVFMLYILTVATAFNWFVYPNLYRDDTSEFILRNLFLVSTIGFLAVGGYAIIDVYRAMRQEFEQMKKQKDEVKNKIQEMIDALAD